MKREYGVELIDFYRGDMSVRLLGVYVRQLSVKSSLVRALNDGQEPWDNAASLIADLWALWAKEDHPVRAERIEKARAEEKRARVIELRAVHEKRKRAYGLG